MAARQPGSTPPLDLGRLRPQRPPPRRVPHRTRTAAPPPTRPHRTALRQPLRRRQPRPPGDLADKTIVEIHQMLRRSLEDAVNRGMLDTNPRRACPRPTAIISIIDTPDPPMGELTPGEAFSTSRKRALSRTRVASCGAGAHHALPRGRHGGRRAPLSRLRSACVDGVGEGCQDVVRGGRLRG